MPINGDSLSLIGLIVAGLLTIIVLSFAIKDNALFRIALYLLIGVSAGYAGAVAIEDVIYPELLLPLFELVSGNPQNKLPTECGGDGGVGRTQINTQPLCWGVAD